MASMTSSSSPKTRDLHEKRTGADPVASHWPSVIRNTASICFSMKMFLTMVKVCQSNHNYLISVNDAVIT